jgi:hypothetical protein
MPIRPNRPGRVLVVAALLLTGCAAEEKFSEVGPDLGLATTAVPATTATTLPALVPYAGDGFSISLPGPAKVDKQTTPSANGPIEVTIATVEGKDNAYGVAYNSVPTGKADLDAAARGTAEGVKGTLTDVKTVTYKGHPARDFRVAKAQNGLATVFARVLFVKKRIIIVQAVFGGDLTAPPNDLYQQVLASLVV